MSVGFRKQGRPARFWLRVGTVLGLLAVAAVAIGWWWWTGWAPSRDHFPTQGMAISSAQGTVDWREVRNDGADFAYIRATTGARERDLSFARNLAGVREAGLRYGAELAYDPCAKASEQATLFITTVPRDAEALPPAIRLDRVPGCAPDRDRMLSELNTLINLVEAHGGKPAILHVSEDFEAAYDIGGQLNRSVWLESAYFEPGYADHGWVIWTASRSRRIQGLSGPVEWLVVAP